MIAEGAYRYEIRHWDELIAVEEELFRENRIVGTHRSANGSDVYETEALLDANGLVVRLALSYQRGPFSRRATYEATGDFLRGTVTAMGGRTVETSKLGRFREVDAGLVLFRALILAHVRGRGQTRWTGRVAVIDSNTLVARSQKQSLREKEDNPRLLIYEPGMGDLEEIEIDEQGCITRIADNRGRTVVLAHVPRANAASD